MSVADWAEISRLHRAEGLPIKTIARTLGISRNTVRAALAAAGPPRYERKPAGSAVDGFEDAIRAQLKEVPTMPATVIADQVVDGSAVTALVRLPEPVSVEGRKGKIVGVGPVPRGTGQSCSAAGSSAGLARVMRADRTALGHGTPGPGGGPGNLQHDPVRGADAERLLRLARVRRGEPGPTCGRGDSERDSDRASRRGRRRIRCPVSHRGIEGWPGGPAGLAAQPVVVVAVESVCPSGRGPIALGA